MLTYSLFPGLKTNIAQLQMGCFMSIPVQVVVFIMHAHTDITKKTCYKYFIGFIYILRTKCFLFLSSFFSLLPSVSTFRNLNIECQTEITLSQMSIHEYLKAA